MREYEELPLMIPLKSFFFNMFRMYIESHLSFYIYFVQVIIVIVWVECISVSCCYEYCRKLVGAIEHKELMY